MKMDSILKKQRIASLILKESTCGLNLQEREELIRWCQSDPRNNELYRRLHKKNFSKDLSEYKQLDPQQGFEHYQKRYGAGRYPRMRRWYWGVAAAIVFMVGISFLFSQLGNDHEMNRIAKVIPGSSKAILVLHNGDIIDLAEKNKTDIPAYEKISIHNNGSELLYAVAGDLKTGQGKEYNELIVPRGGEFALTLSDGTKVWLNSQSKLRYPVTFNGTLREVYLEGEAYFEVAKDARHPFHVSVRNGVSIEVLGTSFNVRSYSDETNVETVLEEGSIRMTQGSDSVTLTPGHKAIYYANEPILVTVVNTELSTAWRYGQYIFDNESVDNILKQLSRWYDIEVFYSNEAAKSVVFSGDVRKYNDINILLNAMRTIGGLHFEMKGKTLVVGLKE